MRTRINAYTETRTQLTQNTLKEGNYAIRDLTDVIVEPAVSPQDFIYSKFVTTVIVIVPVANIPEFQRDYAIVSDYVIPGSAKKLNIPEKDGLSIWRVNIFNEKVGSD